MNLETDILAKHILRVLEGLLPGIRAEPGTAVRGREGSIDLDFLARHGFLK